MFEDVLYSSSLLRARTQPSFAEQYWRNIDIGLESARARDPRTVWLRQAWTPPLSRAAGGGGCCRCCGGGLSAGAGREHLVLRYRTAFPPALAEFVSREEWSALSRELDAAMAPRDGCIDKCCAIATFAVLFYTTIFGIFFYMCAEHSCNAARVRTSRAAVEAVLLKWDAALAPRGIHIAGRWHADRAEELDEPLDSDGHGIADFPLICITLPRPPTPAMPPPTLVYAAMPTPQQAQQYAYASPPPQGQQGYALLPRPAFLLQGAAPATSSYQQQAHWPQQQQPPPPPPPGAAAAGSGVLAAAMYGATGTGAAPVYYGGAAASPAGAASAKSTAPSTRMASAPPEDDEVGGGSAGYGSVSGVSGRGAAARGGEDPV